MKRLFWCQQFLKSMHYFLIHLLSPRTLFLIVSTWAYFILLCFAFFFILKIDFVIEFQMKFYFLNGESCDFWRNLSMGLTCGAIFPIPHGPWPCYTLGPNISLSASSSITRWNSCCPADHGSNIAPVWYLCWPWTLATLWVLSNALVRNMQEIP